MYNRINSKTQTRTTCSLTEESLTTQYDMSHKMTKNNKTQCDLSCCWMMMLYDVLFNSFFMYSIAATGP